MTPYGDGLSVLIKCDNRPGHDWMSFISWYSMKQNLPDAKVVVSCTRGGFEMLKWCPRQRVVSFRHRDSDDPLAVAERRGYLEEPVLVLRPELIVNECLPDDLIRLLSEKKTVEDVSLWCLEAKDEEVQVFSSVAEGCGTFHTSRWIDRGGNPLGYADRFLKGNLTAGERKVFNLWYKAAPLYDNIG